MRSGNVDRNLQDPWQLALVSFVRPILRVVLGAIHGVPVRNIHWDSEDEESGPRFWRFPLPAKLCQPFLFDTRFPIVPWLQKWYRVAEQFLGGDDPAYSLRQDLIKDDSLLRKLSNIQYNRLHGQVTNPLDWPREVFPLLPSLLSPLTSHALAEISLAPAHNRLSSAAFALSLRRKA